ncbi:BPSS1780 family membrane protein [Hydrogenophaga sp. 5NK40-0174]|uniref:BPSS1780 family membrane protein n=1 Tax=Hydrogenophaga sp. 5NK40-0174 TaxID=3127649 RepID=UPI003102F59B
MKLNKVPARTGLTWIGLGFQTFRRQPFALGGIFFLCFGLSQVLQLLPIVGTVSSLVLAPALQLGMFSAARRAVQGEFPMPSTAFEGLAAGPGRRHMLVLGAMFATIMILLVLFLQLIVPMGEINVAADAESTVPPEVMAEAVLQAINPVAVLLFTVLSLLIYLAFFHAPALTHWHGVPPVKSLFFSVTALWANAGAVMVFLLAWAGIGLLAVGMSLQFGLLLGGKAGASSFVAVSMLMLAAVFSISSYFCYRDSFIADTTAQPLPDAGNDPT